MNPGKLGEDLATLYLKSKGYKILRRNWTCHWGELDIVAKDKTLLVFVEVRYREYTNYGEVYQSIDTNKKRKLCRTIEQYMFKNALFDQYWRLDAVCLTKEFGKIKVEHFENVLE